MENKTISTKDTDGQATLKAAQTLQGAQSTPATVARAEISGVFLTHADAEEYRTYKKRKKLTEVTSAIAKSEGTLMGGEDVQRACERAMRLRQAAVKLPLSKLSQAAVYLAGSGVKLDCVIGGTGETLPKIKALEAKEAVKRNAKEITLVLTHSNLDGCRYGEIRREIRKVRRAAKKADVKVCVQKPFSPTVLARVARLCSEARVKYLSIPNFEGCERVRIDLMNGCQLEVVGVETGAQYRKLIDAGVGRIVTDRAWEIYADWLRDANEQTPVSVPVAKQAEKALQTCETAKEDKAEKTGVAPASTAVPASPALPAASVPASSETNYRCRLEGTQLKFL